MLTQQEKLFSRGILNLFTLKGKSIGEIATEGQVEIFGTLIFRHTNRVQIITSTQYGKSLFVGLACLYITCLQKQIVAVVAPKDEKAKIIMRYYIEHLGDSPIFYKQLERDTKLERLRMEENKERIMLRNGGGIFVISAQSSNSIKGFEAAMGEGAEIVIEDEAALIPDITEATIFRMIAGHKDGFYCKIGNPFYRNHFFDSWKNPNYAKVFINYQQGLKEGRYTQEFIDEAKSKAHFNILFNCVFPDADTIDELGYTFLIPEEELLIGDTNPFGEIRLGVDVAESGGDYCVIVARWANTAKVILKYQTSDTMDLTGRIVQIAKELGVLDKNIFIDSIGVGKGVVDRLREQHWNITPVKVSESAHDEQQFVNKRAENYWEMRKWLKLNSIEENMDWLQICDIKFKVVDSSGKIQIMPKDLMRKIGYNSPDVADALMLTFARKSIINKDKYLSKEERETLKMFDSNRKYQTVDFNS
ncbi:hypothetical protein MUP35_04380 [Patescibacteria group bacterium]|nr:hypothetical protein [Patescibacteria group bacterium]